MPRIEQKLKFWGNSLLPNNRNKSSFFSCLSSRHVRLVKSIGWGRRGGKVCWGLLTGILSSNGIVDGRSSEGSGRDFARAPLWLLREHEETLQDLLENDRITRFPFRSRLETNDAIQKRQRHRSSPHRRLSTMTLSVLPAQCWCSRHPTSNRAPADTRPDNDVVRP